MRTAEPRRRGIPFVVSAPSGTGKTTVCHRLVSSDPDLVMSISHTTRAIRTGEVPDQDYHFVSRAEFERLIAADAFLEHAEYRGNLYGTSLSALEAPRDAGRDVLLEIEVQGGRQVRTRVPEARFIGLLPPSRADLEKRLRHRGTESEEIVQKRLEVATQEIHEVVRYDYLVVNDDLERAVAEVRSIVQGERSGERAALEARFGPKRVLPGWARASGFDTALGT